MRRWKKRDEKNANANAETEAEAETETEKEIISITGRSGAPERPVICSASRRQHKTKKL